MSTSNSLHVLVSGGGIAGNAVALQLLRAGIRTTVVERAAAPRPGGQAVDLRGPSREVAERMGLMPGIRKYQLDERGMAYVEENGREFVRMPAEMFDGKGPVADIEITRGDLNQVLLTEVASAAGELDYRYGEWIQALTQDDAGVDVTFASGRTERFDLVVGADGVHSATRQLAFGPAEQFVTYLGGYMSFFTMPTPAGTEPGWFKMHTVPSAAVAIRPDADPATSKAIVTMRTEADPALRRDVAAQQRLIHDMLAEAGWETPAVLDAMTTTPDFYFDMLARVDMPSLSTGRVTLLGDSGFCGSPMTGMGTAMAIVGAYVLAGEIAAAPNDLRTALTRYEEIVTPFLDKAKELPGGGIKMMLPTSRLGTRMARTSMKLMTSRLMRPLMLKMMSNTDDYVLPTY
ncbi:FAD-dependent monooxygenase [Nocardia sp. NBC_00565]|uniref:FAD-dependent monooxygenase n=1 Tax=Nocardia sp. NBC_00565 TaxID=2975993 RepID=UPI002E81C149|nr:FAD-dependent monooxygenase [Nocardia sp. NBC_00565]WUC06986.1 FAD-dependent monooxygenase [Nocardia sp. NBC_00565]